MALATDVMRIEQCMWIGKGYIKMKHTKQNRLELNLHDIE